MIPSHSTLYNTLTQLCFYRMLVCTRDGFLVNMRWSGKVFEEVGLCTLPFGTAAYPAATAAVKRISHSEYPKSSHFGLLLTDGTAAVLSGLRSKVFSSSPFPSCISLNVLLQRDMSLQDYTARWLEPQNKTVNAKACCIALNPTRSLVAVGYTRFAQSCNFFEPQITQSTI